MFSRTIGLFFFCCFSSSCCFCLLCLFLFVCLFCFVSSSFFSLSFSLFSFLFSFFFSFCLFFSFLFCVSANGSSCCMGGRGSFSRCSLGGQKVTCVVHTLSARLPRALCHRTIPSLDKYQLVAKTYLRLAATDTNEVPGC